MVTVIEERGILLSKVGARPNIVGNNFMVEMGIYLPGIKYSESFELLVKIIHEKDQFTPGISSVNILLDYKGGNYDLWNKTINLTEIRDRATTKIGHFGEEGKYIYRYQLLKHNQVIVPWFSDPWARMSGPGTFSAFEIKLKEKFQWNDKNFKVPLLKEMIIYKLNVEEFNKDLNGVNERLDYIQGLGVNVIELMPITNIEKTHKKGVVPISYLCPSDRIGNPLDLKMLVNECHKRGIAVILDSIYNRADNKFAYKLIYSNPEVGKENPMFTKISDEITIDFNKSLTKGYFTQVNRHLIEEYHIDGFCYNNTPEYYNGPATAGYSELVYDTYNISRGINRFKDSKGHSRIIQCAKNIEDPKNILLNTYSSLSYNEELIKKSHHMTKNKYVDDKFIHIITQTFKDYPREHRNIETGEIIPQNIIQNLEDDTKNRLISNIETSLENDILGLPLGNRNLWYITQPYIIALLTIDGIPMISQGQEICENNSIHSDIKIQRPIHWNYMYDESGKNLLKLYRKLGQLRRNNPALRSSNSHYFHNQSSTDEGIVIYARQEQDSRKNPIQTALVFLNFSPIYKKIDFQFPLTGDWEEVLHEEEYIRVQDTNEIKEVIVPSNYGKIYILKQF